MKDMNPPAIVRTSRAELEQEVKGLWGEFQRKAEGLGKKLSELRDACEVDQWLPLLQKLGIPRATAHRLIAKFKTPDKSGMSQSETSDTSEVEDSQAPPTPEEPTEDERGDAWEPPAEPAKQTSQAPATTGFVPSYASNGAPAPTPGKPPKTTSAPAPPTEPQSPVPETPADILKRVNRQIESFCRTLMKTAEDGLPDDYWLRHDNRREGALRKVKDACEALRSCKCSAVCPKCDEGKVGNKPCVPCHGTGRLPKLNLDML